MTHARVILSELTLTHHQSIIDPPPLYLPLGVFFNHLFLPPIGRFLSAGLVDWPHLFDHRQALLTASYCQIG
jgi:hypothetical protein